MKPSKYSFKLEDLELFEGAAGQEYHKGKGNTKRFITAPDHSFRCSFARVDKGVFLDIGFQWWNEFFYVIQGGARITARSEEEKEVFDLEVGDTMHLANGWGYTIEVTSKNHFVVFLVAVPASSKDMPLLAKMTPENLARIRERWKSRNPLEYTSISTKQ